MSALVAGVGSTTTTGPAIEVDGLTTGYNGVSAVRRIDLVVQPGEMVALVGPNGSGKSTTLLAISGLLRPFTGTIEVLGQAPNTKRPHVTARRGLAHVAESRCVFPHLTVAENLKLGRARSKSDTAEAFRYFPALEPLAGRRAGLLSGGEQQMMVIARALLARPTVMMVDEMSLGLAPMIAESVLHTLRDITRETGLALLLVEQHIDIALAVCDRGYVLSHGEMTAEGPCSELAERREVIEASYLGEQAH